MQLPSSSSSPVRRPEWASAFGKKCEPSQAPPAGRAQYDQLTWFPAMISTETKTRLTSVGAAEEERNLKGSAMKDAPIYVGEGRGRAPGKGVKGSDIPAPLSGTTQAGGKRERAPVREAKGSDNPSTLSETGPGTDDMDTSETLTAKRERAPVEGVMNSDAPERSVGEKCR